MTVTIGIVANVYQEVNALPGWLEAHLPFADDVRVYHSGPQGEYSTDGTIELLERWRVPVTFGSIDEGFGAVRTKTVRSSPCDWVMLLDADERFYPVHRRLTCFGKGDAPAEMDRILRGYDFRKGAVPDWDALAGLGAGLRVDVGEPYDQGARLRELLACNPHLDAVAAVRRHWHNLSWRRPTQSWFVQPDWQMRLVRNCESIFFDPDTRMHERLLGPRSVLHADMDRGPFFDHFHFLFKRLEPAQRAHDVEVYDAIHEGRVPPTWKQFNSKERG